MRALLCFALWMALPATAMPATAQEAPSEKQKTLWLAIECETVSLMMQEVMKDTPQGNADVPQSVASGSSTSFWNKVVGNLVRNGYGSTAEAAKLRRQFRNYFLVNMRDQKFGVVLNSMRKCEKTRADIVRGK